MSNKAYAQYSISDIRDGKDGVGILELEEQYYKSTSNSSQTGGSWSSTQPTWEDGYYIWTRIKITWDNDVSDPEHITYTDPVLATTYQSLHTDVINRINSIATKDENGNWSLTNGVIENTYVYTSEGGDPIALGEIGANITTTKDQILSTVSNTYATTANLNSEINKRKATYVTCSTAAGTKAKIGSCSNFELYNGAVITCVFSNANTQAAPTLNVNGTGAKTIVSYDGKALTESEYKWKAGSAYTLVYDGTYWRMQDSGTVARLTTAESSITQNANNIALKVSESDVTGNYLIGKINLDSTTATISASRVNITGDVIVSKLSDANKNTISASAISKAEEAIGKAEDAQSDASDAVSTANSANSTAQSANTNASNALSKANSSIKTDTLHYLATSASSGVTKSTSGWTTTVQSVDSTNRYLWTYHTYTKADNTTSDTNPVITGVYGDPGTSVTVSSTSVTYQKGTSGTEKPTGTWGTSIPTVGENEFLWTKTVVNYSDGKSTEAYSVSRNAKNGTNGTNGTSPTVSSAKTQYQQSTSGTTTPTGTWLDTPPTATLGQYMWTKTTVTYSDSKTAVSYTVSRNGEKGDTGVGITSVTPLYYGTNSTTAPAKPTTSTTIVSSSTEYNKWNKTCPTWTTTYKYYFTCSEILYDNNTKNWSDVVRENALETANSTANTANSNASNALEKANTASGNASSALEKANTSIVEQKTLYYLTNGSAPAKPTKIGDVSTTSTSTGVWTTVIPTPKNGYTYYTCTQTKNGVGTYAWIGDSNNKGIKMATDSMIANWCSASDSTYINGGSIYANSITTNQLSTDAIKNSTYTAPASGSHFSTKGSFFDLATGNITTPAFSIEGANGTSPVAYFKGNITATSLTIGDTEYIDDIQSISGKASATDLTTEINQRKAKYGTSSTAAGTQIKAVTCANFELVAGNELTVKFSTANTYTNTSTDGAVQLSVNGKTAKNVWVANAVTSPSNKLLWGANAYITFRYDGSQFIVIGEPRTWYGSCSTVTGTVKKVASDVTGCVICKGTIVNLAMTYENTAAEPTLNIQSTGDLALYAGTGSVRPTVSNGRSWGNSASQDFVFDGVQWRTADSGSSVRAKALADDAAKVAKNFLAVDNSGVMVYDGTGGIKTSSTVTTGNVLITNTGMQVRNGTSIIASYSNNVILGKNDGSTTNYARAVFDYHSMQLFAKDDDYPYFYVSDLRDEEGIATASQTFSVDSTVSGFDSEGTTDFTTNHNIERITSVIVNNVDITQYSVYAKTANKTINMYNGVFEEEMNTIRVEYSTKDAIEALTFGGRHGDVFVAPYSVAEGFMNGSSGHSSHAEGYQTLATGDYSHSEGMFTQAFGIASHAEGYYVSSVWNGSGYSTRFSTASGDYSHSEGCGSIASGSASHAEGYLTNANKHSSHAEGSNTTASGQRSHAEGYLTTASNLASHAEGVNTTASGWASHAEGYDDTTASGYYSHAEGRGTTAFGESSHAEGKGTTASGEASHAEGYYTLASGYYSHAQNQYTVATRENQTVIGKYNACTVSTSGSTTTYTNSTNAAFVIGGGSSDSDRKDILTVDWNGYLTTASHIKVANGNLIVANGDISATDDTNVSISATCNSKTITLHSNTGGNRGVYHSTGSHWLIYTNDNNKAYIPTDLTVTGSVISRVSTLNLGSYVTSGILTTTSGQLMFSIPTGRVLPNGTTISSISFNIVARAGSSSGQGIYIIKKSNGGTDSASFSSSSSSSFYNGANTQKSLTTAMWADKALQGSTNISINLKSGSDYFFSGNSTNHGYTNNQPVIIQLSNITVNFTLPSL